MGCCCSQPPNTRFKNLVVRAYSSNTYELYTRDGMQRLRGYVSHNPEKIPKVCRKLQKLIQNDLQKRRMRRVQIGVAILEELMKHTKDIRHYVSPVVLVVVELFKDQDILPHTQAAILLTQLLQILLMNSQSSINNPQNPTAQHKATNAGPTVEHLLRLLLQNRETVLQPLHQMAILGIETRNTTGGGGGGNSGGGSGGGAIHNKSYNAMAKYRYAAIVTMTNLCLVLGNRYFDVMEWLLPPILMNLQCMSLRLLSEARAATSTTAQIPKDLLASTVFPMCETGMESGYPSYATVCVAAFGAMASSTSPASSSVFFRNIVSFLDTFQGWSEPWFAIEIIHTVCERGVHLEFAPLQALLQIIEGIPRPEHTHVVLDALTVAIRVTNLIGSRPQQVATTAVDMLRTAEPVDLTSSPIESSLRLLQEIAIQCTRVKNTSQCVRIVQLLLMPMSVTPSVCLCGVLAIVRGTRGESFWGVIGNVLNQIHESPKLVLDILSAALVSGESLVEERSAMKQSVAEYIWATHPLSSEIVSAVFRMCRTLLERYRWMEVEWIVQFIELCQRSLEEHKPETSEGYGVHDMATACVYLLGSVLSIPTLEDYARDLYFRKCHCDPMERCSLFVLNLRHEGRLDDVIVAIEEGEMSPPAVYGNPTAGTNQPSSNGNASWENMNPITRSTIVTYLMESPLFPPDSVHISDMKTKSLPTSSSTSPVAPSARLIESSYSPSSSQILFLPKMDPVRRLNLQLTQRRSSTSDGLTIQHAQGGGTSAMSPEKKSPSAAHLNIGDITLTESSQSPLKPGFRQQSTPTTPNLPDESENTPVTFRTPATLEEAAVSSSAWEYTPRGNELLLQESQRKSMRKQWSLLNVKFPEL
eukprot:PhF_6_TR24805/c0_g1_i1/m.34136